VNKYIYIYTHTHTYGMCVRGIYFTFQNFCCGYILIPL